MRTCRDRYTAPETLLRAWELRDCGARITVAGSRSGDWGAGIGGNERTGDWGAGDWRTGDGGGTGGRCSGVRSHAVAKSGDECCQRLDHKRPLPPERVRQLQGGGGCRCGQIELTIAPPQQIEIEAAGPPVLTLGLGRAAELRLQPLQTQQQLECCAGQSWAGQSWAGQSWAGQSRARDSWAGLLDQHQQHPIAVRALAWRSADWGGLQQGRPAKLQGRLGPALQQLRERGAHRQQGVGRLAGGAGEVGPQGDRQRVGALQGLGDRCCQAAQLLVILISETGAHCDGPGPLTPWLQVTE